MAQLQAKGINDSSEFFLVTYESSGSLYKDKVQNTFNFESLY